MRVTIIALLALVAIVGVAPPTLASCGITTAPPSTGGDPVGGTTGPTGGGPTGGGPTGGGMPITGVPPLDTVINIVINIVVNLVGGGTSTPTTTAVAAGPTAATGATSTTGAAAAPAAGGATTPGGATTAGGATTPTTTPTAFTFPPSAGGGGVGGGGGGMGGGGFPGGGSSVGGMPINPSSDYVYLGYTTTTSSSGGGGGLEPIIVASTGGVPMGGEAFPMGSPETSDGPLTAGVKLASLPEPKSEDNSYTVAMASPATAPSASPGDSSAFGLEEPMHAGGPIASGFGGTTFLAALIGVGVLGAGWAWRSLVV